MSLDWTWIISYIGTMNAGEAAFEGFDLGLDRRTFLLTLRRGRCICKGCR